MILTGAILVAGVGLWAGLLRILAREFNLLGISPRVTDIARPDGTSLGPKAPSSGQSLYQRDAHFWEMLEYEQYQERYQGDTPSENRVQNIR